MPSAFVAVHRTVDPIEARFVADVLTTEGIEARIIGTTNAASVGAAQHIMKVRVEVARAQADGARIILEDRLKTPMALDPESIPDELREDIDDGEEGPPEPGDTSLGVQARPPSPRRTMFAIAAPFVFPGGSHFYVSRPWTGAVILMAFVVAMWLFTGSAPWAIPMAAFVTLGLLVVLDLAGGLLALRGERLAKSKVRQLVVGAIFAFVAMGAGLGVGKFVDDSNYRSVADSPEALDRAAFQSNLPRGYRQMAPAMYLFEAVITARGGGQAQ